MGGCGIVTGGSQRSSHCWKITQKTRIQGELIYAIAFFIWFILFVLFCLLVYAICPNSRSNVYNTQNIFCIFFLIATFILTYFYLPIHINLYLYLLQFLVRRCVHQLVESSHRNSLVGPE